MKNVKVLAVCLVVVFFAVGSQKAEAGTTYIDIADGQIHNFDDDFSQEYNAYVMRIDYQKPGMQTTLNYLNGAKIHVLEGYEDSIVNVYGGSLAGFNIGGRSQLFMSFGSVGDSTNVWGSAEATIEGGAMGRLFVSENGRANVSGGGIDKLVALMSGRIDIDMSNWSYINNIMAGQNAVITLVGSGFAIDGQPVDFGNITSIGGNDYIYETVRHLTGTFSGGQAIDCDFRIGQTAKIILVPEPCSLVLLFLGGLVLRRKKQ